jgi:hypothetical protein
VTKKPGQGFSRRVTAENLNRFEPLLRRAAEGSDESEEDDEEQAKTASDPAFLQAEALFKGTHFKSEIPFHRAQAGPKPKRGAAILAQATPELAAASALPEKGPLVWQKTLPASDVQRQRGNPTGGVRLTQASWRDEGKVIDQTTYFRNKVFAELDWHATRAMPHVEEAAVNVNVTVLGNPLGIQTLVVSHKPSGEASQANYTTILQWKGLSQTVREANLTGKTLRMYAPLPGRKEPFFIEIV